MRIFPMEWKYHTKRGESLIPADSLLSRHLSTYACTWFLAKLNFLKFSIKELFLCHVFWFSSYVVLGLLVRISKDDPKLLLLTNVKVFNCFTEIRQHMKSNQFLDVSWLRLSSFLVESFPCLERIQI